MAKHATIPSLLLLCSCLLGPSRVSGQSGVTLRGTLVDILGGGYVGSVSLTLFSVDRVRVTKSDNEGRFEFANLPPGKSELIVEVQGFKTRKIENIEIASTPVDLGSVNMVLGTDPQSVLVGGHCRVNVPRPNDPRAAFWVKQSYWPAVSYNRRVDSTQMTGLVRVYWSDPSNVFLADAKAQIRSVPKPDVSHVVLSNAQGEFSFAGVEPGKYEVVASHDGYMDSDPIAVWITRENLTRITLDMIEREVPCRN